MASARATRGHQVRVSITSITSPTTFIAAAWMVWNGFYAKLFNFRQIRFFDIEGRASGLFSRALTSPDGKIRIPINEDACDSGQIEEYLNVYRGEGIQHIACGVRDIYRSIETRAKSACRSCRHRPTPISRRSMRACPSMAEDVAAAAEQRHFDRRRECGRRRPYLGAAADFLGERDRLDLL